MGPLNSVVEKSSSAPLKHIPIILDLGVRLPILALERNPLHLKLPLSPGGGQPVGSGAQTGRLSVTDCFLCNTGVRAFAFSFSSGQISPSRSVFPPLSKPQCHLLLPPLSVPFLLPCFTAVTTIWKYLVRVFACLLSVSPI